MNLLLKQINTLREGHGTAGRACCCLSFWRLPFIFAVSHAFSASCAKLLYPYLVSLTMTTPHFMPPYSTDSLMIPAHCVCNCTHAGEAVCSMGRLSALAHSRTRRQRRCMSPCRTSGPSCQHCCWGLPQMRRKPVQSLSRHCLKRPPLKAQKVIQLLKPCVMPQSLLIFIIEGDKAIYLVSAGCWDSGSSRMQR